MLDCMRLYVIHTLLQSRKPCKSVVLDLKKRIKIKAAPRFELGVEVLQTSALPLGIIAVSMFQETQFSISLNLHYFWRLSNIIAQKNAQEVSGIFRDRTHKRATCTEPSAGDARRPGLRLARGDGRILATLPDSSTQCTQQYRVDSRRSEFLILHESYRR